MTPFAKAVTLCSILCTLWGDCAAAQPQKGAARKATGQVEATGPSHPALQSFDRMMLQFMRKYHVPGASLAVTHHGRLVYARGFGYADVEAHEQVQPGSLFRIASISKPFTSAAILQLVARGKLKLTDRMVDVLGLSLRGEKPDNRLERVTIHELLQHRGGWDRDKSFDPMFRPFVIAREMGVQPPAGPNAIIGYMMGMPLDFDPGQRYAYSNFGYCVLGRVIEKLSGEPYERYVQKEVLAPLAIHDMRIGHSLLSERAAREVRYYNAGGGTASGVVHGTFGKQVPVPYGGFYLEALDAHGGWIASAVDLVRFASAFDVPDRSPILGSKSIHTIFARPPGLAGATTKGKPRDRYYACGWDIVLVGPGQINTWHTGLLDGTSSILVRRFDGLNWAVLFNTNAAPNGETLADLIDPLVHEAADAVREWPDIDLFPRFLPVHAGSSAAPENAAEKAGKKH